MNPPLRLLVAERPLIASDALAGWLAATPGLDVVATAGESEQVLQRLLETKAGLVLLDLNSLPCGTNACVARIKRSAGNVRVVVLYSGGDRETIGSVVAAGADGFVEQAVDRAELADILRRVGQGGAHFGAELARVFAETGHDYEILMPEQWELEAAVAPARANEVGDSGLTQREREILRRVATGHSSQAIAEQLCISVPTVRKHRENLMRKIGLHNTAEVTAFALRTGLLPSHAVQSLFPGERLKHAPT